MREEIRVLEELMNKVINYCKEKEIKTELEARFKKGNDRLNIDWRI